ncbi:MAG: extracellular solute-binding protein [Aristaeellaceae bacterium]
MKRFAAIAMVLALLLTPLFVQSALAEDVVINWYSDVSGWGPANWNGVSSSPLLDALKENFGVTMSIEQPATDAATKLALMIATNDLPDLISITDSETIAQLIESGYVYTIPEFLEQYDPDSHLLKDFPEDVKKAITDAYGDWWFFPSHMDSVDHRVTYPLCSEAYVNNVVYGANSAIMFNTKIMEDLGITQEDVQTQDAFMATLEKVKNSGYTVDGKPVIPATMNANLWIGGSLDGNMSMSFGIAPVDAEGNYRHKEMNPGYKEVLKFANDMVRGGYMDLDLLTLDEHALVTMIDAGQVFCWFGNPANTNLANANMTSFGPILSRTGAVPVMGINSQAGTGWIKTFVSKNCKNPEALAKAFSFMSSEEGLWLNYYGVEGADYTKQEDGTMVRTAEGLQRYNENYIQNIWLWPFNDTDFFWCTTPGPDKQSDGANGSDMAYSIACSAMGRWETTYIYNSGLLTNVDSKPLDPTSDLGIKYTQIEHYLESQKAKIVAAASEEEFEKEYQAMIDTLNSYDITAVDAALNEYLQAACAANEQRIENPNAAIYEK